MPGTPIGGWEGKVLAKPELMEWQIPKGITRPGVYGVRFEGERGIKLNVNKVEILQDGKVLAVDERGESTPKAFHLKLPAPSSSPLILRATAVTEETGKKSSTGTVYIDN